MRVVGTFVLVIGLTMITAAAYIAVFGRADGAPTRVAAVDAPSPVTEHLNDASAVLTAVWNAPRHVASASGSEDIAAVLQSPASRIDEVQETWRQWMSDMDLSEGSMAMIGADGRMTSAGLSHDPARPYPIMSLSKAITGLCLDTLLTDRNLDWTTSLGEIAPLMSAAGVTPRSWNAHVTLSALATHTAGLGPDITQGALLARHHGGLGLHRRFAADALTEGALTGTPGRHVYANTNYAVLGVVIEALSGRPYAQTCLDRVMAPAEVTDAVIEGRHGSMSSFAGWEMSAESHARFARYWFHAAQPHVARPEGRPFFEGYGMGYWVDGQGHGASVTHNGRFCEDDAMREGTGAFFVALGDGTVFSANWNACLDTAHYTDLRQRITPLLR